MSPNRGSPMLPGPSVGLPKLGQVRREVEQATHTTSRPAPGALTFTELSAGVNPSKRAVDSAQPCISIAVDILTIVMPHSSNGNAVEPVKRDRLICRL